MVAWDRLKKHLKGDIGAFAEAALTPAMVLISFTCLGGALWRDQTGSETVPEDTLKGLYESLYRAWKHLETLPLDHSEGGSKFPKGVKTFADAYLQNIRTAFALYDTTTQLQTKAKKRRAESASRHPDAKRRDLDGFPPIRSFRNAGVQEFLEGRYKDCREKNEALEAKLRRATERDEEGLDDLTSAASAFFYSQP